MRGEDVRQHSITASPTNLYAPIRGDLCNATAIFDAELRSDLTFINNLCETVRSYRGKMLRPALLLLSGKAAGELTSEHHTLAAVVEIVHMATLVHDDVLDEADERRRRPSIRSLTGNTGAVLLGDYLISHAFHLCSSLPDSFACRRIGATTNTVCEGELLQNHLRGNWDLDEETYLEIVRRKTAALTATACELGAYYAGADASTVSALRTFGESAGIAFQIVDDCLDITGDAGAVGKTLGRDAALGKLTLPTLHGLANAKGHSADQLRALIVGQDSADRERLHEMLVASGSLDYALAVAGEYVAEARAQLELLPSSDARDSLTAMADFILQRSY